MPTKISLMEEILWKHCLVGSPKDFITKAGIQLKFKIILGM